MNEPMMRLDDERDGGRQRRFVIEADRVAPAQQDRGRMRSGWLSLLQLYLARS